MGRPVYDIDPFKVNPNTLISCRVHVGLSGHVKIDSPTSFYMEGEALVWFQDDDEVGQFPTWDDFLQALLVQFGPAYDDPMESLMKLHQSSSVAEYTTPFKSLSNRLQDLSDKYKLGCFLSGLKDEICLPLRMITPHSLVVAFGLAKL